VTLSFEVNYLAVVAGAIAGGVIGAVYYGALGFADRGSRLTTGAPRPRPGPRQMALGMLVGLVNAWVIAVFALNLHASSIGDAVLLGVLIWFGFAATFKTAQVAFEGRPWGLWTIQAVHDVLVEVVLAIIVTLWR
jgi:hypothetical protein